MQRLCAALLILLLAAAVQADSWPPARAQAKASENAEILVRIVPGNSMGDVFGFGGQPKGAYAKAEWHRYDGKAYVKALEKTLLNPIAPVDIEVTNRGVLVTLDNWHNRGIGNALVIYSANGEVKAKFTLLDLYPKEKLERIKHTVSSVHWRCPGLSTSLESDKELWIDDSLGGRFYVNLDAGSFRYESTGGDCKNGRP